MKQLSSGITISPELQAICPDLVLGCLSCQVQISAAPPALCAEVATYCADMAKDIALADVNQQPAIARTRAAYRALGKEPSRYRPSAEALMRRVAQGKGLYQVNNVVDLLNLLSLKTGFSIGGWDAAQIDGDAILGIGKEGEPYTAIGRGDLNIAYFPTFRDAQGAFGTPTSDSMRTRVRPETQQFLMAIYAFGNEGLALAMQEAQRLLLAYGGTKHVNNLIISTP